MVDSAGHKFFPRPGLALDENPALALGNVRKEIEDALQFAALADHVLERILTLEFAPELLLDAEVAKGLNSAGDPPIVVPEKSR